MAPNTDGGGGGGGDPPPAAPAAGGGGAPPAAPAPAPSAPAPTPAAPASAALAGDPPPWFSALAPELQQDRNVTKYESLDAFAKAHQHALKRFGSKDPERLLEVPASPDDKEGWTALYRALGAPETVDGYGIQMPEGSTDADKAAFAELAGEMLAVGVTPAQFAPVIAKFGQVLLNYEEQRVAMADQQAEADKRMIGELFGEREPILKKDIGGLIREAFAGDEDPSKAIAALDEKRWGGDPYMMRLLAHVVDKMAEPGGLPGGQPRTAGDGVLTPYAAQGKLAELHADPAKMKAMKDRNDPQHKTVIAERNNLLKMAYPAT